MTVHEKAPVPLLSSGGVTEDDGKPRSSAEVWDRLQQLPSMKEEPLVWDHRAGGFVPGGAAASPDPTVAAPAPPPPAPVPTPPPAANANLTASPDANTGGRWRQGSTGAVPRQHVVVQAEPPGAAASASGPAGPAGPPVPPARIPNRGPAAVPPPKRSRAPKGPKPPKAGKKSKRLKRVVLACVLVPLLLFVALFAYGWVKFSQIPRADVASVLSPATGAGTNYLIVGTDSREGIDPNDPNAGAFLGEKVSGSRTDSIMVMRMEGDQQSLLSIPRDLWVKDPKTGQMGRINSTFEAGPANLIKAVQNLGIPVHHYLEINFVSFGKLVDSVGGIDVDFPFPARDQNSGLAIDKAGVNHLDGTQALAYVRARHYEELKNGKWVTDPQSDLGRVQRQRTFLTSLMNEVTGTRNPISLVHITDAMSVGLKIDNKLNFLDALLLGWKLKGFHPESASLPVTPRTTSGGADVLDLKQPDARGVIAQYN